MKIVGISIAILLIGTVLKGQNTNLGQSTSDDINTITTAVPFLMIAPDSRAGGMGDVGAATSPDANSQHWNPAKYGMINEDNPMGFSVSYIPWLRSLVPDINLAYVSGYYQVDKGSVLSGSLRYFSLGEITFTNQNAAVIGQFTPTELAFDLGFARRLTENFSGAMSLRYIYSNLTGGYSNNGVSSHPGQAVAADISGFYSQEIEISDYDSRLNFGLNISNIGNRVSYSETGERDFIPINMRLGAGIEIDIDEYNRIGFYTDVNKLLVPTPPVYAINDSTGQIMYENGVPVIESGKNPDVSVPVGMFQSFNDAPGGIQEELREFTYSAGMEYWYSNQLALRGGYFYEHATKGNRQYFTLGAGLKYRVFALDFAYMIPTTQNHPLQNTLRFSLAFDFQALKDEGND